MPLMQYKAFTHAMRMLVRLRHITSPLSDARLPLSSLPPAPRLAAALPTAAFTDNYFADALIDCLRRLIFESISRAPI